MKHYCVTTAPDAGLYRPVSMVILTGTLATGCRNGGCLWIYSEATRQWTTQGTGYQGTVEEARVPQEVRLMVETTRALGR